MKKQRMARTTRTAARKAGGSVDFMVVAAHPDDAEIFAGGTVLALRSLGRTGVLVDVTDGGAGTRGSATVRAREAAAAARVLGVERVCLGEPDGVVRDTLDVQWKLIREIRRFRPKVMFTHHFAEEHPDHGATAALVKAAAFRAGLKKLEVSGESTEAFRPGRVFYAVHSALSVNPSFCVDVSAYWEKKLRALRCYASQFHNTSVGKYKDKTDIATPAFMEALEIRGRFYGQRIRRRYAEAFWCEEIAEVADPTVLGMERFP